ncbi:MAG: LCP family protein [Candidatus Nanopelagicales bacterium]|nr:LCP family protein [Candidatus Nanopelagicales bacterium]
MHKRAVAAVVLLAMVIGTTVWILLNQQNTVVEPPDTPQESTGQTLLVQVRDPSLLAQGSVLMGVDPDQRLNQLWWTPQWWIDQIGIQEVSAAELGRKPVTYAMQQVQNQTEVVVDDAWVLDRLAFAGLVDAVGGVRLDLAAPAAYLTDDGTPALLPAGVQRLAGAAAADYVLDTSLKDESARLQRFQAVWDQILRLFPTSQEKARTLIVSLGALSKTTMPAEELADLLSEAHDLRVSAKYAQAEVALEENDSMRVRPAQGVRVAYALDATRTARRLGDLFEGFAVPDEPIARIRAVRPREDVVEVVRAQLLTRSWQSAWAGRTIVGQTTSVVDPGVPADEVVGLEQALGVPPLVQEQPLGQALVGVAADDEPSVGS